MGYPFESVAMMSRGNPTLADQNRRGPNKRVSLERERIATQGAGRILVVDDEEDVRNLLSRMLSVVGYEVKEAGTGHEAFNLFLQRPFDLVLTDLNMPGLDGWGLARRVKGHSPKTPVVLITGEKREHIMNRMAESDVDCALFKPCTLKEIHYTLQDMLVKKTAGPSKPGFPSKSPL
jgi:CheY-like chemotaxis protein